MGLREHEKPREPKPVGELIEALSSGRGWGQRLALGTLRRRWPEVVGETVAARCEPVKLEAGSLTIRAESGPWATEMILLAKTLAAKADAALGGGFVTEVRVVSGGGSGRGF